jgi:acyl CoA:acetate/3-ketoacid CoA transferase alpha subunit
VKTISLKDAAALIPDGASVMIGGFMGVGTPERLVDELVRQKKRNLTVIANDNALPGVGIGKLVSAGALRKTIASHIGLNPETQKKMLASELEVDLVPQGTLIERIRAAGFGQRAWEPWSKRESNASRSTASLFCSRPRCAPTSLWCRPCSPTTSATFRMP